MLALWIFGGYLLLCSIWFVGYTCVVHYLASRGKYRATSADIGVSLLPSFPLIFAITYIIDFFGIGKKEMINCKVWVEEDGNEYNLWTSMQAHTPKDAAIDFAYRRFDGTEDWDFIVYVLTEDGDLYEFHMEAELDFHAFKTGYFRNKTE